MAVVQPENTPRHEGERAAPTTMPWCGGPLPVEEWETGRLKRAILAGGQGYDGWADAATQMCRHKTEPTWIQQATYLVQTWMNARQGTQAEAEPFITR